MDSELKNKIDSFIDEFLKEPSIKQFLLLKKQIEEDDEIISLRERLKKSQKEMALSLGTNLYESNKDKYNELKMEYDNHPLIVNYYVLKDEVDYLLNELKDKLK